MQKCKKQRLEIDYFGSVEFDLTEVVKDLIYNIKSLKNDVDAIKKHSGLNPDNKR